MSKRRVIPVAIALVAVIAVSGVAYAWWTAGGTGTGDAKAASGVSVTANQITILAEMYPGDSPQTISGNFDNLTGAPVFVTKVTASIGAVTPVGAGPCTANDFSLTSPDAMVGHIDTTGSGVDGWTGPQIQFKNDTGRDQNGCKGATVTLAYTVS